MIKIRNLSVKYNEKPIIKDISISFPLNSFISIVGPNGSGKSTLIKSMSGILPFFGDILYNDQSLTTIHRKNRAKLISYLPQTRLIADIDVATLIEYGRFPHLDFFKKLSHEDYEAIQTAIELTNISHLIKEKLSHLSGGERQRVYLAMAIAQDSKIFLLDEPMTYLDINHQMEILKIVLQLHKKGKTIIMAAHDLPQAFSFSQYICVIDKGSIIAYDSPANIANTLHIQKTFGYAIKEKKENVDNLYSYSLSKNSGGDKKC